MRNSIALVGIAILLLVPAQAGTVHDYEAVGATRWTGALHEDLGVLTVTIDGEERDGALNTRHAESFEVSFEGAIGSFYCTGSRTSTGALEFDGTVRGKECTKAWALVSPHPGTDLCHITVQVWADDIFTADAFAKVPCQELLG